MPASDADIGEAGEDLALILDAAREAGQIALGFFRQDPEVWWKEGKSPVSEADFAVDRFLQERLLAARPGYGWLSEETAASPDRLSATRSFIVDPIDGTRAFIGGKPVWCVSVAVVEDGRAIAGVLDCPALEEVYSAQAGAGAFFNGQSIAVKEQEETLLIGGPQAMLDALPPDLLVRTTAHSHVPSLAYRVALVARGALDATFIKPNAHDWDLAAADLILREAGGGIVDGEGKAPHYGGPDPRHGALAAGNPRLIARMAATIASMKA